MSEDSSESQLVEFLEREIPSLKVDQIATSGDAEQATEAGKSLHSTLKPRSHQSGLSLSNFRDLLDVLALPVEILFDVFGSPGEYKRPRAFTILLLSIGLGFLIFSFGVYPVCWGLSLWAGSCTELAARVDMADSFVLQSVQWLTTVSATFTLGYGVLYVSNSSPNTPQHGDEISVQLLTPGDGTVEAYYDTSETTREKFTDILRRINPGAVIRDTKNTTEEGRNPTFRERLGVPVTDGIPAGVTPHAYELTFEESQPHDALAEGTTTEELMGETDIGLPLDRVTTTLAQYEIPILVQVSAAARPTDDERGRLIEYQLRDIYGASPSRSKVLEAREKHQHHQQRTDTTRGDRPVDHPIDMVPSTDITSLFDVSVQILIFEPENATVSSDVICTDITHGFASATTTGINEITQRRIEDPTDSWLPGQTADESALSALTDSSVSHQGAYRFHGLVGGIFRHKRTALPATPAEIWRYLLITGDGSLASQRGQDVTPRHNAPTDRPSESQLSTIRSGATVDDFVEDTLNPAPDEATTDQSPEDHSDAHTDATDSLDDPAWSAEATEPDTTTEDDS